MYHLLKGQHKPRIYYHLNEKRVSEPGITQESEPPTEREAGAIQEPEPVYTVIGEPVLPTEESGVITIVLDPHPTPYDHHLHEEPEEDQWPMTPTPHHRFAPLGWSLVGVALVLVGVLVVMLIFPWFETSATVTIVPLTRPISTTLTAHLVLENADQSRQQVQGRQLATLTISQVKTVATTGSGYQPSQAAQGVLTFYNALPIAQTIPAGTLIIGQDGTQVTTDTTVTIPAGQFANNGQAQVSAHATEPGPAGNISALDIHGPCCRTDVLAQNAVPFTGGQNTRVYQAVSAQDITRTSTALEAILLQEVTVAYQAELADGESLITPVACVSQVKADHPAGAEAVGVTVSVTEACQGAAYETAQMRALVLQAINEQGSAGAYQLSKTSLHVQVTSSGTRKGDIQIQAYATLAYHWNQQQLCALAALIAGKSEVQARAILLRQLGISKVIFHVSERDTETLPDDLERIQIIVL